MRNVLAVTAALLTSVGLLMLAGGMFGSFIGLRSVAEGFPREIAGSMMSAFYAGLIAGTLRCGRLINRVGHIRAFGAFCAVTATAVLAFPLVAGRAKNKQATTFTAVTQQLLGWVPKSLCRTLTLDNGTENAGHELIAQDKGMAVYFAHPHAPWQRGARAGTRCRQRRICCDARGDYYTSSG